MVLQRESAKDWHTSRTWFKSCPRCHTGDVFLRRDHYGWYLDCLQCGWVKDLDHPNEANLALQPRRRNKQPAALAA